MMLFMALAQITLVMLDYGAGLINVSPYLVFLPGALFVAVWIFAISFGYMVNIDAWPVQSQLFEAKPQNVKRAFQPGRYR